MAMISVATPASRPTFSVVRVPIRCGPHCQVSADAMAIIRFQNEFQDGANAAEAETATM